MSDGQPTHFKLREFENRDGLAMVHPALLCALEALRTSLNETYSSTTTIEITDAVRTEEDNNRLGRLLGWTTDGGLVAPNSKHLAKFGGIAADIKAYCVVKVTAAVGTRSWEERRLVPEDIVLKVASKFFDFVKGGYKSGHIHVDMRGHV